MTELTESTQVLRAPAPVSVAPTSGGSAAQVLLAYIRTQCAAIADAERELREGSHEVHDVRVAVRRLRSLLRTFASLFTAGSAEVLESELRWYGGLLGAVRDPEVMRDRLVDLIADQ